VADGSAKKDMSWVNDRFLGLSSTVLKWHSLRAKIRSVGYVGLVRKFCGSISDVVAVGCTMPVEPSSLVPKSGDVRGYPVIPVSPASCVLEVDSQAHARRRKVESQQRLIVGARARDTM